MIFPDDQHALTVRRHAKELANCSGWQDWAMPWLRQRMQRLAADILSSSALRGEELAKARAAFQALEEFTNHLRDTAEHCFKTSTPSVTGAGIDAHLLDPTEIRMTLEALNWRSKELPTQAPAQPIPPTDDGTAFSPFTAPVTPAPRQPTPSKP